MLSIDPNRIDPLDLYACLFETHTLYKDYEACENLNVKVRASFKCMQSALQDESVDLYTSVFQ